MMFAKCLCLIPLFHRWVRQISRKLLFRPLRFQKQVRVGCRVNILAEKKSQFFYLAEMQESLLKILNHLNRECTNIKSPILITTADLCSKYAISTFAGKQRPSDEQKYKTFTWDFSIVANKNPCF